MKKLNFGLLKTATIASLFVLMIFSSCDNQLQPTSSDKAYVTFAASISRTVFPTVTVENCTSFTLTGVASESTETTSFGSWTSYANLKAAPVEVTPGTWSFTLTAVVAGLTYTQTLTSKEITAGSSTTLEFALAFTSYTSTSDTTGTLSYTITYPLNTAAKVITAGLYTKSGSTYTAVTGFTETALTVTASSTENTATYTAKEIPSGNYFVGYTIYGDEATTVTLNSNKESVYIADGLTTTGTKALSSVNSLYTVTYEPNSGTLASTTASYSIYSQITLPTSADITRTGYTFDGWYTASDFTGTVVTEIAKGSTGNITLYAKWTATSTTTYTASTYAELENIIESTIATGTGTVTISGSMTTTSGSTISVGGNVTINADSSGATITRDSNLTGSGIFTLSTDATLVLGSEGGTLTLDGGHSGDLSSTDVTAVLVKSQKANLTIGTNCVLQNNYNTSTSAEGGAIYFTGGASYTLTINGKIDSNYSACKAGGIYVEGTSASDLGNIVLNGCTISNNSTPKNGGGLNIKNANMTISSSTLTGNTATTTGSSGVGDGGAIYYTGGTSGTCTIDNSSVIGNSTSPNTSGEYGGGIYINTGTVTLTSGTISNNTATKSGANVYLAGGSYIVGTTTNTTAGTAFEDAQSVN